MEEYGANYATKAGEGAMVYNWEGLHQTINELQKKQYLKEKTLQDAFAKSDIELKKASEQVRPGDLPELSGIYDTYRGASMELLKPGVQKNAKQKAHFTKIQSDSYIQYLSKANESKEFGQFIPKLVQNIAKDRANYKDMDELAPVFEEISHMPTSVAKAHGYNTPLPYIAQPSLYPEKEYDKHVYSGFKDVQTAEPIKDDKTGETIAWQKKTVKQPVNPIPVIAHNVVEAMNKVPAVYKSALRNFENDNAQDPSLIDNRIFNALGIVSKLPDEVRENIEPYLRKDAIGYELADKIINSQPAVIATGERVEDTAYKAKRTFQERKTLQKTQQLYALQRLNKQAAITRGNQDHAASLKINNSKKQELQTPDVDMMEHGLSNPTSNINGKTALELTSDFLNKWNSATTGVKEGVQLQPLPFFTDETVRNNTAYQDIVQQTTQRLKSAMNPEDYSALKSVINNPSIPLEQKKQAVADVYNKINQNEDINSRFTADDIGKSVPVILRHVKSYTVKGQIATETRYGILKPGTPEFRDMLENSREKYLKQHNSKKDPVSAYIGDMNNELDDD